MFNYIQTFFIILMLKDQGQNQRSYIPSKYSRSLQHFSKTEIPSIIPLISTICKSCQYSSKFPVFKMLKAVIKLFMLNEIQIIFVGYLIKETKWNIHEKIILNNYSKVSDFISVSIDNSQYKMLTLYLMVVGYTVKYYLNAEDNLQDFGYIQEVSKLCPNFRLIFEAWAKNYSSITMKISPKTLNKIYIQLYASSRNYEPDFNILIDAIIQISPAYNAGEKNRQLNLATEQKIKVNKQKDKNQQCQKQKEQIAKNSPQKKLTNPLFSSSGIFKISTPKSNSSFYNYGNNNNGSYVNPFLHMMGNNQQSSSMRNLSLMRSSFAGLPHQYQIIDDQQECQQLILGLEEGQSQDNIIFHNGDHNFRQRHNKQGTYHHRHLENVTKKDQNTK